MKTFRPVAFFIAIIATLSLLVAALYVASQRGAGELSWLLVGLLVTVPVLIVLGVGYRGLSRAERQVVEQAEALRQGAEAYELTRESERDAAERFRAVIDNAHDAIVAIDSKGSIETFNKAAVRIFGYQPEEVIGQNVKLLMPEPYRDAHDKYIHNYVTTGVAKIIGTGREVQAVRKDGTVFPIDLSVGEMAIGDRRGFIGVIRDITERHVAERRVQELTTELVHVSRLNAMGQFSSSLAHELNQPLTAIMNYTEAARQLLANAKIEVPPRVLEFIEKASGQADRAGQIIRRLRSFVEKGAVERAPEHLNKVVEEASMLATVGSRVDGIKVTLDLPADLPPVYIDKIQIQQVVVNLVRNAIEVLRRAERRELVIKVTKHDNGDQEVTISDTGPGIPPEIADQLFKPFVTTKKDGMGIGLSISRSIIDGHGGRIWVENNPGGGATFRFILPALPAEEAIA
ncbi:PAS domain S-box protein [uncultured Ferrovibrio sp.]|jgi:two-component system sensor kinase FixL|uniref:PAS domain S-box protein n=1 Tax=uncultured Ferrovibrio sp. TaxID=1576913 RepID=UPI00261D477F|nr:PAS domain S-box protein [uncultured Ferrovibrio sp.]